MHEEFSQFNKIGIQCLQRLKIRKGVDFTISGHGILDIFAPTGLMLTNIDRELATRWPITMPESMPKSAIISETYLMNVRW